MVKNTFANKRTTTTTSTTSAAAKFNTQQASKTQKKQAQEDKEKQKNKRLQEEEAEADHDYDEEEEEEEDTGNDEYNSVHLEQEEEEEEGGRGRGRGRGNDGVSSYREDDEEAEAEGEGEGFNNLSHGNSNSNSNSNSGGGGGGGVQKKQKQHFGSFKTMGLESSLVRGIIKQGYNIPTPIQRKTIPIILSGKDVVAMARTGSGKTAAFLVPMFELLKVHSPKVGVRAVVLSPTRELAMQTLKFVKQLGKYMDLRSCLLLGGDSMEAQFADLASNPDIIIATPGRLMHHIVEVGLSLRTVEYIVFDEADRLFEMGFASQLTEIISKLPEHRQTLLFSATLPQQLVEFARAGLSNPHLIRLDTETKISETLMLAFFTCRIEEKSAALLYLLKHIIDPSHQTIVFAATRHHVEYLYELLRFSGFDSAIIYGTMDQTARKINIGKFRNGKCRLLIVTDVAARGIDIPLLNNVINYDFPPTAKLFIHRVGRAARMGRSGTAYSLVSADELPYMIDIHLFLGRPLQDSSDPVNAEGESCFGRLPQDVLDAENEFIKEQTRLHSELQNQYKVTLNAYKLYYKTRAKASGESVRRAKEAFTDAIHPLILKKSSQEEKDRHLFIAGLKQFRPPQTVFELGRDPTKPAAIIMSAKRQQHSKIIEKAHNKQTSQHIPDEDVVLVSGTPEISAETKRARDTFTQDKVKKKKQKIFRDEQYYMNSLPANHLTEKALSINETGLQSNNVAFEVAGDDAKTITQNTKVKKWDRKKKKYVWADQGVDVNNKKMMIKNESGRMIKAENRGKMYQDWQNKYKVSIQRSGETEDTTVINKFAGNSQRWEFKHQGAKSEEGNNRGRTPKPGKRDLKTKEQIQKQRKQEFVKRKKINAATEKRQHKKKSRRD